MTDVHIRSVTPHLHAHPQAVAVVGHEAPEEVPAPSVQGLGERVIQCRPEAWGTMLAQTHEYIIISPRPGFEPDRGQERKIQKSEVLV